MHGLLYPKKSAVDATNEYGDGDLRHVPPFTGGPHSTSGQTGSSRSYPKGRLKMSADFNPQKTAVTKIYVGGID